MKIARVSPPKYFYFNYFFYVESKDDEVTIQSKEDLRENIR